MTKDGNPMIRQQGKPHAQHLASYTQGVVEGCESIGGVVRSFRELLGSEVDGRVPRYSSPDTTKVTEIALHKTSPGPAFCLGRRLISAATYVINNDSVVYHTKHTGRQGSSTTHSHLLDLVMLAKEVRAIFGPRSVLEGDALSRHCNGCECGQQPCAAGFMWVGERSRRPASEWPFACFRTSEYSRPSRRESVRDSLRFRGSTKFRRKAYRCRRHTQHRRVGTMKEPKHPKTDHGQAMLPLDVCPASLSSRFYVSLHSLKHNLSLTSLQAKLR